MSPRKPTLDDLIRDAREERAPEVNWAKIEEPLFARVAHEARSRAAIEAYQGKRRSWAVAAVVIAAAAAVPLFFAAGRDSTFDAATAAREPSAGAFSWKEPTALVHLTNGSTPRDVTMGETLSRGDVIESHGGRVIVERTDASGASSVTWGVEDNTRVEVHATRGTLILALARGAVEAQVAPVANGEAFAIDVNGTRVAVHGTHLRVAREGSRATVNLREGVVSIGLPPRSGSTYGDLVTAPAHVEFDSSDPHGTLKVTHEMVRLRAAAVLDRPEDAARKSKDTLAPPLPVVGPAASPGAPALPAPVAARPSTGVTPSTTPSASPVSPSPASVAAPVPPPPTPPQVNANPERKIADAVRACESAHVAHATGVIVTVSSRLELRVGDSGMVDAARFDPPLAPDVQKCAVAAIYGTRFSTPGAVTIPVNITP